MNKIPPKLREEMAQDGYYSTCSRKAIFEDHICQPDPLTGKMVEWEHTLIFASKQIQEKWAIIPICWFTHRGGHLDKEKNVIIALNRATDDELRKYSKTINYIELRKRLNKKYGLD